MGSILGGGVMVVVAVFGLYGAATGRLAPMLAAIFDPKGLSPSAPYTPPVKVQPPQQIKTGYKTKAECQLATGRDCVQANDGTWVESVGRTPPSVSVGNLPPSELPSSTGG